MKVATYTMTLMAAACLTGVTVAEAQMQPPQAQQQAEGQQSNDDSQRANIMNKLNELQEEGQKLQQQINAIAHEAVEKNPEISEMHNDYMSVYQGKLAEYGYPGEEELDTLRGIQQKLQSPEAGNLSEEERQQLTQTFNAGVAKLQEAQEKAQQDPEVVKAQEAFNEAHLKAMQQVDPKTMELQRQYEDLEKQIVALRQALQSQLQQGPQQ